MNRPAVHIITNMSEQHYLDTLKADAIFWERGKRNITCAVKREQMISRVLDYLFSRRRAIIFTNN